MTDQNDNNSNDNNNDNGDRLSKARERIARAAASRALERDADRVNVRVLAMLTMQVERMLDSWEAADAEAMQNGSGPGMFSVEALSLLSTFANVRNVVSHAVVAKDANGDTSSLLGGALLGGLLSAAFGKGEGATTTTASKSGEAAKGEG